jgi:hypothetical protein
MTELRLYSPRIFTKLYFYILLTKCVILSEKFYNKQIKDKGEMYTKC